MEYVVLELEPYSDWFATLDEDDRVRVLATVQVLRAKGFNLRFPLSSGLEGSKYGVLRELRVQASGEPIRIAYAFDPNRQAVLLLGGNKAGDDRFYRWFVPQAEKNWEDYLAWLKQGEGLKKTSEKVSKGTQDTGAPKKKRGKRK